VLADHTRLRRAFSEGDPRRQDNDSTPMIHGPGHEAVQAMTVRPENPRTHGAMKSSTPDDTFDPLAGSLFRTREVIQTSDHNATLEIAERCKFRLPFGAQSTVRPAEPSPWARSPVRSGAGA
jgi:hypothetical protein